MKRYFDNLHYEKFSDGSVKCIEDEIPFDLPDGWAWSRIKNISLIGTGATPLKSNSTYYKDGTIPWITSAATSKASITLPTDYITNLALAETNCTIYPVGTLIIAMYGEGKTRGQISELDIEACTSVQRRCCSQRNFHGIKVLDDGTVFADVVILVTVEHLGFAHFLIQNISTVCFVNHN